MVLNHIYKFLVFIVRVNRNKNPIGAELRGILVNLELGKVTDAKHRGIIPKME